MSYLQDACVLKAAVSLCYMQASKKERCGEKGGLVCVQEEVCTCNGQGLTLLCLGSL